MDTRLDADTSGAATAPRQLLPAEAYTGADWFRREQELLFARSWVFAGMAEDLKAAGDYVAVDAGTIPLFLIRGENGELRAFHNICRHRGARLLEGRGNAGRRLVCFYHSWSYELTGELASVTLERDQFPGLDKSCLGLHKAKVGVWRGLVFVNADPAAEELSDWLGDLPQKIGPHVPGQRGPFDPEALVEVASVVYQVRANWKIVVENFIDGYHLPLLHRISLRDGDFMKQRWQPAGRHISFYRPLKPGVSYDKETLPVIDGVPATYGLSYNWIFPNLAISETATRWATFHVLPLAPDLSLVHSRSRAMPAALERLEPAEPTTLPSYVMSAFGPHAQQRLDTRDIHPLQSNDVMREDIYACEAVQRGLSSPRYSIGPLSRWEATLPFFQQRVLDALAD